MEDKKERTKELEPLKLYTLTEIEPILGVSHRTLLQYVKDRKIKVVKIGGKWKISEENLKRFINGEG